MVGGDGEPRGRRKFIRKPKRRHAAELADDAIRVGIFGASPVINKDMACPTSALWATISFPRNYLRSSAYGVATRKSRREMEVQAAGKYDQV